MGVARIELRHDELVGPELDEPASLGINGRIDRRLVFEKGGRGVLSHVTTIGFNAATSPHPLNGGDECRLSKNR
jgi:hypothetical protein